MKNKNITNIIYIIASIFISTAIYVKITFVDLNFEQVLFALIYSEGASYSGIVNGIIFVVLSTVFLYLLLMLLYYLKNKLTPKSIKLAIINKEVIIFPIHNIRLFVVLFLIISIMLFGHSFNIFTYLKNQIKESNFYLENYVEPNEVQINFKEKRNLIYIYLEAMESTILSKENGGQVNKSYIPKLEELALNNTNFSQNNKLGGASVLSNTTWTIAGMVAQTSGISLNIPIDGNSYTDYSSFLPGITSLGEILENNGYHNYLMLGSRATFAGRNEYFSQHGNYTIYDYDTAISENYIDDEYFVWWGYEDKKLFEFSKEKLLNISKNDEPFNFTMLTVDTHFESGYLDETCNDLPFDNQYANVFYCNSNMVYNFVNWIMEQDFYENTTIILSGDHHTLKLPAFEAEETGRTYNTFINATITPVNSKNRGFATIDMFPTTLAAIGAEIEGNRLGLGTNLFSDKLTLIEEFGLDYVNAEVAKKSLFYNQHFLRHNYH